MGNGLSSGLNVAPHAGAWIETAPMTESQFNALVAPHAGAWIETHAATLTRQGHGSPLTQGRGLKLAPLGGELVVVESPLTQGRGLKLVEQALIKRQDGRPSRRGVD